MIDFSSSPIEMFASFWRNREIIIVSTRREVLGRYRGSFFGLMWSFFNPLLMLLVYTFVFGNIFKPHWSSESESKSEFALILFAGLIVFNFFAECINRAPSLILASPNFVKKIVYPLEILPFISLLSALYHALVGLCVWLFGYMLLFGVPHGTVFYLPLVLAPFALLIMGFSWFLASLGVFMRDISQFIGVLTTVLMFLSPIFYPAKALPEAYRNLFYLNPITPAVEFTRTLLFSGVMVDLFSIGIFWIFSMLIAWLGFAFFQKTRRGFADVL